MKHFILSLIILLSLSTVASAQNITPQSPNAIVRATIQFFCMNSDVVRNSLENEEDSSHIVIGRGIHGTYELWTNSSGIWNLIMVADNGFSCQIDTNVSTLPTLDNIERLK